MAAGPCGGGCRRTFGAVYLVLALVGPGLVGLGDVYLPAVLGMLLGTGPVSSIVVGALAPFLLNTPISAVRLALRRIRRGSHIAWAPYLVAGAVLAKVLVP
jgi:leader peptidase (prepilin peptidase) / N-methyltransferase